MTPLRHTAVFVAVLVLASGVASAATADARTTQTATVTLTVTESATVLTFSQGSTAMSGAQGSIEPVGDASVAGSGEFRTDADGEVHIPTPDEETAVHLVVETDDARFDGTVTLVPHGAGAYQTSVELHGSAQTEGGAAAHAKGGSGDVGVQADASVEHRIETAVSTATAHVTSFIEAMLALGPSVDMSKSSDARAGSGPEGDGERPDAEAERSENGDDGFSIGAMVDLLMSAASSANGESTTTTSGTTSGDATVAGEAGGVDGDGSTTASGDASADTRVDLSDEKLSASGNTTVDGNVSVSV